MAVRHIIGIALVATTGVLWAGQFLAAQEQRTFSRSPLTRSAVRDVLTDTVSPRDLEPPLPRSAAREDLLVHEVLDSELLLTLHPQHSKIIRTRAAIQRVSIADPTILDMNEFDPHEVEFIGGSSGQTTVTLWMLAADGRKYTLRYLVRCLPDESKDEQKEYEYALLQDRINEFFPNSQVQLFAVEDKLIIRGQAHDAKEARDILRLLGQRFGRSNGQNGDGGNGGRNDDGQNDEDDYGVDLDDVQLINLMRVPGEHQVMLKVRIAELSRNAARELGVNLDGGGNDLLFSSVLSGGNNLSAILNAADLQLFLRAFSTHGYGKILAEPTLVTISGRPATFLAGGEFAVPTAVGVDGIGSTSTTFRGFGTQLSFTPTVVDKDLIRLQVSPSFSTLNTDATVNGIPGLNSRSVDTTVDLREGQWLAIAGLIQDEQGGQKSEVPFLRRIPGVRHLFASQNTSRDETELVVLVSPQLIHPLDADEAPMMLPGMEVNDPTDDAFFRGRLIEGDDSFQHRSTTWPEYRTKSINALGGSGSGRTRGRWRTRRQDSGYCDSEAHFISGPSGFSE